MLRDPHKKKLFFKAPKLSSCVRRRMRCEFKGLKLQFAHLRKVKCLPNLILMAVVKLSQIWFFRIIRTRFLRLKKKLKIFFLALDLPNTFTYNCRSSEILLFENWIASPNVILGPIRDFPSGESMKGQQFENKTKMIRTIICASR